MKQRKKSLIAILKSQAGRNLPFFYKALEKCPPYQPLPPSIAVDKDTCKGGMFVSNNFYKPISRGIKISTNAKK